MRGTAIISMRAAVLAAAVMAAVPDRAMAGNDDDLIVFTSRALAAAKPSSARRIIAWAGPARQMLSTVDGHDLQAARTRIYDATIGPFDLSLLAARFKGGRPQAGGIDLPGDRFSGRTAGLIVGLDLGDGLALRGQAAMTHMRRRLTVVDTGARPLSTDIATVGIGIAQAGGSGLMLDYARTTPTRQRRAIDRMAELIGGAPAAGSGFRLSFTTASDELQRGALQWRASLATMRRPLDDSALATGSGSVADHRAELALAMAF